MRRTILFAAAVCFALASGAWAQDTSQTQAVQGSSTTQTQTLSGTVVYVSGNDLVVRLDDGHVKAYNLTPGATATVEEKEVAVKDVVPGMRLAGTITTTTNPTTVESARIIKGRVWYVDPPSSVILTLPEGNTQYRVPEGQKFNVDGEEKTVWDLQKGVEIIATVVQTVPRTEITRGKHVAGKMPLPIATPELQGALLFEELVEVAELQIPELPRTGSPLHFLGFLGLLLIGAAAGLRSIRT